MSVQVRGAGLALKTVPTSAIRFLLRFSPSDSRVVSFGLALPAAAADRSASARMTTPLPAPAAGPVLAAGPPRPPHQRLVGTVELADPSPHRCRTHPRRLLDGAHVLPKIGEMLTA